MKIASLASGGQTNYQRLTAIFEIEEALSGPNFSKIGPKIAVTN